MLENMQSAKSIERSVFVLLISFFFMFYFSMLCVFIKVLVHQSLCSMFIKVLALLSSFSCSSILSSIAHCTHMVVASFCLKL